MLAIGHFIFIGGIMFGLGLFLLLTQRNPIKLLIGIELMLNSAILNFAAFSKGAEGYVIALFVMGLAVAETALALALLFQAYRKGSEMDTENL